MQPNEPTATNNDVNPHNVKLHPMVVLQPGERVVGSVKRHPFGIVSMYAGAGIAILVLVVLGVFVLPGMLQQSGDGTSVMPTILLGVGILVVLLVLMLGIATIVYWQNEWVITTDSITQITQSGLFGRQVSQLSMDNLEDVSVDQIGIIPHMFNFGTLKVETAGERSKFTFPYCPNPNQWARQILAVHEAFLEERRNIRQLGGGSPNASFNS